MGKKSKKKTGAVAPQRQQQQQNTNSSNATTATITVANNAMTMAEPEPEPIAKFDMDVWTAMFPFAEKTTDPQAKELDMAHEIFLKGVQLTKTDGNLSLAGEYIASAYLRDDRALIISHDGVFEAALDFEVLTDMIRHEMDRKSTSLSFGILCLIMSVNSWPSKYDTGDQYVTAVAMKYLNAKLDDDTEDMMLETSTLGQLGGLTRAKLYYWRGRMFKKMLNGKSAIKDWTKALELDPSLAAARLSRLHLWAVTEMKSETELHAECILFLGLVHEDYSELDAIYALLAMTYFFDARLGTYADAMEYYSKSLQATSRRVELYGPRHLPDDIIYHVRIRLKRAYQDPEGDDAKERRGLDILMGLAPSELGDCLDQFHPVDKTKRNGCLNCQKNDRNDGIQLRKCSRCKRVYYCSKECIRAHWKEHKLFCHEISEYKRSETKPTPSS